MFEKTDDSDCEYSFDASSEEIESIEWLLRMLNDIVDNEGSNAAKATSARRALARWGEHVIALHSKIHELEDILSQEGYVQVDVDAHRKDSN